ncbi:hypothetical protein [Rhodococcoides kroppenstedtii]|uniref:hypothetical protein n=1 Tax=Rhodococcoides kroppenstedtii TaxID=293050 RepID=UPI0036354BEF
MISEQPANENAPDAGQGIEGSSSSNHDRSRTVSDHTPTTSLTPPSWWRPGDYNEAATLRGVPNIDWEREIPCESDTVGISLLASDTFDGATFVRTVETIEVSAMRVRDGSIGFAEALRISDALRAAAAIFAGGEQ